MHPQLQNKEMDLDKAKAVNHHLPEEVHNMVLNHKVDNQQHLNLNSKSE